MALLLTDLKKSYREPGGGVLPVGARRTPLADLGNCLKRSSSPMRPSVEHAVGQGDRTSAPLREAGQMQHACQERAHSIPSGRYRAEVCTREELPISTSRRKGSRDDGPLVRDRLHQWEAEGYGHLPVCMAKTQYSFSSDPNLKGAPSDHVVPIRDVHLSAGAEFVVAICGDIMTLPGLPRVPAANNIRLDANGLVEGLF